MTEPKHVVTRINDGWYVCYECGQAGSERWAILHQFPRRSAREETMTFQLPPDHVPHLGLGDRFSTVGRDGVVYTDTVQFVSYQSGESPTWPTLSRWQRFVRRLTPRRWLKPLKPIREGKPAAITVGGADERREDVLKRHQRKLSEIEDLIGGFTE